MISLKKVVVIGAVTGGSIAAFSGCSPSPDQPEDADYVQTIDAWHQERIESLREKDSWLSLAGLYRLEPGENSFGADSSNDIVFPSGKAPDHMGTFTLNGGEIRISTEPEAEVRHKGSPVGTMELVSDDKGDPTRLTYNSLQWYVIERRDAYFVRLKDTDHPNFASFRGIERYPVSSEWRVKATFKEFEQPETISIPDVLDEGYVDSLYGILGFEIDGKNYELAPLRSPESDRFFIIFGDRTNGDETYGGGRYLYIDTPEGDNTTYIDFNKSYNPPCVFTEFATCPLPPAQNRLPLEITAGEKVYEKSDK